MKTVAIIPCLNEAKHVGKVVRVAKRFVDIVVVSDGGSSDNTCAIATEAGAQVIGIMPASKSGYGITIRRGLSWVVGRLGADIVVLLDGDGQHNPREIPRLLSPLKKGKADITMGIRGAGMPTYRRIGNKALTLLCNIGAHFKPSEVLTGYWAVKTNHIPKLTEDKWGLAIELFIKARHKKSRIMGVPVKAIYHKNFSDNSTVSPIRLGVAILWVIIKWRIKCEVLKHEAD